MTRGGALKSRTEPERRCIATGASGPARGMIRFVLSPAGEVVPDLAGKLPGRGVWVTAERALLERAVRKRLFSRGFRAQAKVPEDLVERLEAQLAQRLVELIGLARKAGQAVAGFEKVRARLKERRAGAQVGALIAARDGAPDGKDKLARLAPGVPVIEALGARELGLAFGREFAIHAALDRGSFADRATAEALRLEGLRATASDGALASAPERRDAAVGKARQEGPVAGPGQGDG